MRRISLLFCLSSLALLLVYAVTPVRDYLAEWRRYQKAFNRFAEEKFRQNIPVRTTPLTIRQVWNPALDVVDRCVTCHLGVENRFLRDAPQPFRSHPVTPHRLGEIGCTVCHRGQGAATTVRGAHGRLKWWEDPMLPSQYLQASCGQCHPGEAVPEARILSAGRETIRKAGCTGCHKITGVTPVRPIGPDLDGLGSKVRPLWLFRWLKNPKEYLERTSMPNVMLADEEARLLTTFLLSQKAPATGNAFVADAAAVELGQQRYREARCISCHAQGGRGGSSGPDLGRVGGKVRLEWLESWLRDPKALFPQTRMPQFSFPAKDIRAIVSYIASEFSDSTVDAQQEQELERLLPAATRDNLAAGKKLYQRLGCGGCHRLKQIEEQAELGPDLAGIGSKDVDRLDFGNLRIERNLWSWLFTKIKTPRVFGKNLKMPDFQFSDEQARELVVALLSLSDKKIPARYVSAGQQPVPLRTQGDFGKILRKYECLTCHSLSGESGRLAPDLSVIGSQAKPLWIAAYFRLPYSMRPIMTERMPLLGMSDQEIQTTVRYFETVLLEDSIAHELFPLGGPELQEAARGKELYFNKYGCQACHQVNLAGGYVGPALDGLGGRLFSGYVFAYLKNPQRFKPAVLEPNYAIDDSDARALTAYLVSLPPPRAKEQR
ncbi:MAG: c-type cytochrome [Candidatus Solibacter usitatus]|nr:c-type cytochrome [Candidatus Solibacter usitatus]